MVCPYYRKPTEDNPIGCCNDDRTKIPSEEHRNCLCQSRSGLYVDFCPTFARFQRDANRRGVFKRIFMIAYRKQPAMTELTGIILAGGQSERLSCKNKALLKIGKLSVIERVIYAVSKVAKKVILVTNSSDEFRHLKLSTCNDILPGSGPLGGIYTGLQVSETYRNIIVACDMPFIQSHLLRFLIDQGEGYDFVIPLTFDGYHPLCAVYSKKCIEPIEILIKAGNLKVTDLFPYVKVNRVDLKLLWPDHDPDIFFNINTDEDYLKALRISKKEGSSR